MFNNSVFNKLFRENKMLPDMDNFSKALYLNQCDTGDEIFLLETYRNKVFSFSFNCGNLFDICTYNANIHSVLDNMSINIFAFDTVIMENAF